MVFEALWTQIVNSIGMQTTRSNGSIVAVQQQHDIIDGLLTTTIIKSVLNELGACRASFVSSDNRLL